MIQRCQRHSVVMVERSVEVEALANQVLEDAARTQLVFLDLLGMRAAFSGQVLPTRVLTEVVVYGHHDHIESRGRNSSVRTEKCLFGIGIGMWSGILSPQPHLALLLILIPRATTASGPFPKSIDSRFISSTRQLC